MNTVHSTEVIAKNEFKLKEVRITYNRSFWQKLTFRKPKVERWMGENIWYDAITGIRATNEKEDEIRNIISQHRSFNQTLSLIKPSEA